jgi:flagellar hook-length control protein FliK
VSELAAQIEKETGDRIDPQALADWLKEHSDDYPALAPDGLLPLLVRLIDSSAAVNPAAQAAGGGPGKNPAALLELLITASGGSVQSDKAGGQAAGRLLAALQASGHDGQPLLERANTDPSAPAAFQHLLQSAAAAAPAGPALPATENDAGIPSLQVATPVTQAEFGAAVGDRLLWMVQHEVQHARLQLNPPGLGPLDITVSLHADQISIALNAHHALTREALVADAPRLRGLLADAGFGAVDVNVSSQDQGRGDRPPSGAALHGLISADASAATESVGRVQGEGPLHRGRSLVDHYA